MLFPLADERSAVVTTAGFQSRLYPMGSQFLIFVLQNLCSESVGV